MASSLPNCWTFLSRTLLLAPLIPVVGALSSNSSRQFIELTNPLKGGGVGDRLPASFVANWPTWVLEESSSSSSNNNECHHRFTKIPDDGGYLAPSSVDELWQPMDLRQPQLRLAVGLHIRDGVIRHVMPAVDLSFDRATTAHRNRGLCSVPRAHRWLDFQATAGEWSEYKLWFQTRQKDEEEWNPVVKEMSVDSIEAQIKYAISAITEQPPEELGNGSNILHVVLNDVVMECPNPGSEFRVQLVEDGFDHVVGELHVRVEKTAAGSESEFLPEAYRELYEDETLRRATYAELKRRLAKKESKNMS